MHLSFFGNMYIQKQTEPPTLTLTGEQTMITKATATKFANGSFRTVSKSQDDTAQALFIAIRRTPGFQDSWMSFNFDQVTGILAIRIGTDPIEFHFSINRSGNVL